VTSLFRTRADASRRIRVLGLAPLVAAALWIAPRPARACASCGCGDSTLTATGVERPYRNRLRLAFETRYGSLSMGDPRFGQQVQFVRSTLAASWSPHRRVTVAALLPWLTSFIDEGNRPRQTINGLGDLELAVRGVAFAERGFAPHHILWLTGGLKMPTGYRIYDAAGLPISPDDQPGSGSWDPFAGVTYAWFSGEIVSIFSSVTGRYTTPGWNGYRRGATVGGSAVVQLQPWSWGAVQLGLDAIWQHADQLPNGATLPNSGGTVGYTAIALLANPWRDLLLRLVADAPILLSLEGKQAVGPQVALQISYDIR
jgi:hypothetical protein